MGTNLLMLKLKLSKNPPPRSCLISFMHGTDFDAESNIGFDDRSFNWLDNRTGAEKSVRVHRYGTPADAVGSGDVVVGTISARRRNLVDPTPLPWRHTIGAETAFSQELLVYNPLADTYDPTTQAEEAVAELKRGLQVLNIDGTVADDVIWDVALNTTLGTGGKVDLGSGGPFAWGVFLYLNVRTERERPLLVRYTASETTASAAGALVLHHNHEELIKAEPYLVGEVMEPGSVVPDDYILEIRTGGLFTLKVSGTPACMGLAFWTDDINRGWRVLTAGLNRELRIYNTLSSTVIGVVTNITAMSVRELAQAVNRLNIGVQATALVDYPTAELALTGSVAAISSIGKNPALMASHLFAYYFNESKMYLAPPKDLERFEDWFARISGSPVRQLIADPTSLLDGYEVTYNIGEHAWQPISDVYNLANSFAKDYLESVDEPVAVLTGNCVTVRHRDVLPESLRLMSNGKDITTLIVDFDHSSGAMKLSRDVLEAERITAHYAYDPGFWTELDFINLNPGQLHLPDGYRLFFGVYVIPQKLVSPTGTVSTFSPNVGYIVANSVAEIEAAVENLIDVASGLPLAAQLLGIFQSNSQGEAEQVKILDVRSPGGGLAESVDLQEVMRRNPEAQFFTDIGYWDGEPYAGSGVLVVRAPQRITGADTTPGVSPSNGGFVDRTGREKPDDLRRRLNKHATIGTHTILDIRQ
jgi:hypothetical protein